MAVLGQEMTADQYYPEDDPNIEANTPVRWHIYVSNQQSHGQYLLVKAKLLNSTLLGPNSTSGQASPEPEFFEDNFYLAENETQIFPFYWQISNVAYLGEAVMINEVIVNDRAVDVNSLALDGYNFRIVFELWYYDEASGDFEFNRKLMDENVCVWNQIWFNHTS